MRAAEMSASGYYGIHSRLNAGRAIGVLRAFIQKQKKKVFAAVRIDRYGGCIMGRANFFVASRSGVASNKSKSKDNWEDGLIESTNRDLWGWKHDYFVNRSISHRKNSSGTADARKVQIPIPLH